MSPGTARRGLLPWIALALLGPPASACAKRPALVPVCAPHDALCQSQMGMMADPSCKNGKGSNDKCLDPRAPP